MTSSPITVTVNNPVNFQTGLIGYWKFDEASGSSAADSSANGNNGTLKSGVTWAAGKIGGALHFDGVDDHFEVPDSASLNTTTNEISITAWVNRAANQSSWAMVVSRQFANSSGDQYLFGFFDNTYHFCVFGCSQGPTAPNDEWVHMAGTYDGTTRRLYINGSEVSGVPVSGIIPIDFKPIIIGAARNNSTTSVQEAFNGKIDEVRLYNRALSAAEILELTTPPNSPISLRTTP